MNGESNKMHAANSNSTESNLIRVGEASTKWKAASNTDVASRPLEKDSIKGSAKNVNIKSSKAGLSPVEEVDFILIKYLQSQTQGRRVETSSLLVEADVSLDTTGV